uniref:E3 ubiquitin-protein ligase Sina-like RING finger domain-containing protein n=1 Tax=Graphocephala atropunctata TaxID=36148 RepID=A0A1B6KUS1_9HEMI
MVQCVNGHLFCSDCRGELVECPTCREDFSPNKPSGFITQVVGALPPRCRHKNCGRYIKGDEDHEKYCGFNPTECKATNCEWRGYSQELLQHVRQQHAELITESGTLTVSIDNFNVDENRKIIRVWLVQGQFFWHEIENDTETKVFKHSFLLVPNGKPKNEFFVKVNSALKDTKFFVKIKLSLDPNSSIQETNFISIPKFMLPYFVNEENKLNFNVAFKINKD